MLKKLISGIAVGLALALPGEARVEDGTKPLLELMGSSGIALRYNNADCADGKFLGLYRHSGMKRAMILCYGADADAQDHMVVRHEAIHAVQHCVNVARGTHVLTPVITDDKELMEFTRHWLTDSQIEEIKRVYDPTHWRIEFEAFAGMHAYTADQIADMFRESCIYTEA